MLSTRIKIPGSEPWAPVSKSLPRGAREPVGISDARLFLWQFTQPHREGKPDHRGCVTTCRAKAAVLVNSAAMDDVTSLIEGLNPDQRDAVTAEDKHLLVLAGAGSGKTRVITVRMAHLLRKRVPARHILAVTFTNKAAREMRSRIEEMLHLPARGMWVGTFHGLAHRLLRRHWEPWIQHDKCQCLSILTAISTLPPMCVTWPSPSREASKSLD